MKYYFVAHVYYYRSYYIVDGLYYCKEFNLTYLKDRILEQGDEGTKGRNKIVLSTLLYISDKEVSKDKVIFDGDPENLHTDRRV